MVTDNMKKAMLPVLLSAAVILPLKGQMKKPVFETTFRTDASGAVLDNIQPDFKGKLTKGASIINAPFGKVLKTDCVLNNGVQFGKNAKLSFSGDFTFSCWINVKAWPPKKAKRGFGSQTIVQRGQWRMTADNGGISMQTNVGDKGKVLFTGHTSGKIFDAGQWTHVAMIWKVNDAMRLYINGTKYYERKKSIYTKNTPCSVPPPAAPCTDAFLIGSLGHFFPFNGMIGRFRMYDSALTPAEMNAAEQDYLKIVYETMKKELAAIPGSGETVRSIDAELAKKPLQLDQLTRLYAERDRILKFSEFKKTVKTAGDGSLAYSVVNPLGAVRFYRGSALPEEGMNGKILIAAAQNEYEPASILIKPMRDLKKFIPVMGDLTSKEGKTIPASAFDILLVKQIISENRMLQPNVLIHDDAMLRVDVAKMQMDVRCTYKDGTVKYKNVTPEKPVQEVVVTLDKYPIYDSAKLKPLDLSAGVNQQYWLTLKTGRNMAPGLYQTDLALTSEGKTVAKVPVKVRILPFALPDPATNYDLSKEFSTAVYFFDRDFSGTSKIQGGGSLNHTRPFSEQQLRAYLINLREHGIKHPTIIMSNYFPGWNTWTSNGKVHGPRATNNSKDHMDAMRIRIRILKECGFKLDPLFLHTGGNIGFREFYKRDQHKKYLKQFIEDGNRFYRELLGHDHIYHYGLDEAEGKRLLAEYEVWEDMRSLGAKVFTTTSTKNIPMVAGRIDIAVAVHDPTKKVSKMMHDNNGRLWVYAQPYGQQWNGYGHRKTYGYDVYFANYDGVCNYSYNHWHWAYLPWNMYNTSAPRLTYVMPKADGVVDTPGWEGHREGIDDVRYATKLRQEIVKALKGSDPAKKAAAVRAQRYLDTVNTKAYDFDSLWTRTKIIDYILDLI